MALEPKLEPISIYTRRRLCGSAGTSQEAGDLLRWSVTKSEGNRRRERGAFAIKNCLPPEPAVVSGRAPVSLGERSPERAASPGFGWFMPWLPTAFPAVTPEHRADARAIGPLGLGNTAPQFSQVFQARPGWAHTATESGRTSLRYPADRTGLCWYTGLGCPACNNRSSKGREDDWLANDRNDDIPW